MLNKFLNDEAGAVTIDWVALTAGILLLGIAVVYGIFNTGVTQLATSINDNLGIAVSAGIPGNAPTQDNFTGITTTVDNGDGTTTSTVSTADGTDITR